MDLSSNGPSREGSATRVRVRDRTFRAHEETPLHEHECLYFCLIVDGLSEQEAGRERRMRSRGQVFFYPASEPQKERFGPRGGRVFAIDIAESSLPVPATSVELRGGPAVLARRLFLTTRLEDDLSRLALDEGAMAVLGLVSGELRDGVSWLEGARDYLHAHFRERVTLDDVASAARVHPVHVSRSFPRRFGRTLGEYVRGLRIDYAARELQSTDRPIADIALDAGFASQAHLTRHFTERMGVPPGAFRQAG